MITISIEEAAEVCECHPQSLMDRVRAGDLPGVKFGHSWIIPRDAFVQRLNELSMEEAAERRKERNPPPPPQVIRSPGAPRKNFLPSQP